MEELPNPAGGLNIERDNANDIEKIMYCLASSAHVLTAAGWPMEIAGELILASRHTLRCLHMIDARLATGYIPKPLGRRSHVSSRNGRLANTKVEFPKCPGVKSSRDAAIATWSGR